MAEHDESRKLLFSHPRMVEDLLRQFVPQDWVKEIRFSTLEMVRGSFVSDNLKQRHSDVIWRVRFQDRWLYLYLLLEFQHQVDRWMALRLLVYVGLLYQHLVDSGEVAPSGLLPPVFPMVLYNGEGKWTAATDIGELIEPAPGEDLARYRLRGEYHLLAENELSTLEVESERNLAAALFRLEQSRTPEDIGRVVQALGEWLEEPGQQSLRRAFTVWLTRVLLPERGAGASVPEVRRLQEIGAMLEERVKEWTSQWLQEGRQEGRQEGLQEGLQEGRQEGEAAVLLRQMERKFGPLSEEQRQRLRDADAGTLLEWGDRVLTAQRIDEVFALSFVLASGQSKIPDGKQGTAWRREAYISRP